VIASTILSFSWVNNLLVYPLLFVVMAAVFFATYWVVRELTEPRTYKNIVLFVLVIVLIFFIVKYGLPLLGVKSGSGNSPINSIISTNGISQGINSIKSGIGNLSTATGNGVG
jgi:asparagine N-glycosylation enzyme membrane subunit Stt3